MSVDLLEPQQTTTPVADSTAFDGCGMLAEFAGPNALIDASAKLREEGYTRTDAFSPFPIHGIDEALGIRATILPWIALGAGLSGGAAALLMQWWMNAVDYAYIISGKPLFSLPANIPVTFEVIILSSAFAVFFGMLALNRLPRLSNPLLEHDSLRRATDDGFFLYVDAHDPRFDDDAITRLFQQAGALRIDSVQPSNSSAKLPGLIKAAGIVTAAIACVPPAMLFLARQTTSEKPRIDFFSDMDHQVKFKAQESTNLFQDGRAMRPPIPGTIAVGDLENDDAFFRGLRPEAAIAAESREGDGTEGDDENKAGEEAEDDQGGSDDAKYVTSFPVSVSEELMQRGRTHFNVYCAPCHGLGGQGDGLVSLRAMQLQQPTWVPPTNLTTSVVAAQPHGKLYETISNGRRKMAGYASQIEPEDRWAIVLYVRALQRSVSATLEDVPPEKAQILESQR